MPGEKRKAYDGDEPIAKRIGMESQETPDRDFINTLNDDCLSNIFNYLSIEDKFTVRKVCSRWAQNRRLIWGDMRTLKLKSPHRDPLPPIFNKSKFWEKIFEESQDFLRVLQLRMLPTEMIFPSLVKYCSNLTSLEIVLPEMDDSLYQGFPQMEQLTYLRICGRDVNFSDHFFKTLPHQNLTELHLTATYLYKGRTCDLPPASHSVLEKLNNLSALTLINFCLEPIAWKMINRMKNLTFLSLQRCTGTKALPPLDLPNLEHLNLNSVRRVSDKYVSHFAKTSKNLKYLDLSCCYQLTDVAITELQQLPKLEVLILWLLIKITDKPLSTMYNLRKLDCLGCKSVKDDGIIALVNNSPNLVELQVSAGVTREVQIELDKIIKQRREDFGLPTLMSVYSELFCGSEMIEI